MFINEILFDVPGNNNDFTSQYVELRGEANTEIADDIYLLEIDGDAVDESNNDHRGKIEHVFSLGGLKFGANGFLVLRQESSPYTPDPNASVETANIAGWGTTFSNELQPFEFGSNSFLLVKSAVAPIPDEDVDSDNDGTLDGGTSPNWQILDAIGSLDGDDNDTAYGKINFSNNGKGQSNGEIVNLSDSGEGFNPDYIGRNGNSTGATATDWVAAQLEGTPPNLSLTSAKTSLSGLAGQALNHIGQANAARDTEAPQFTSITRQTPTTNPTDADELVFRAVFSEAVQNVTAADFEVTGVTGTTLTVRTVSGSTYELLVSGGNLANYSGSVGINLAPNQDITDLLNNALVGSEPAIDQTYSIRNETASATPAALKTLPNSFMFSFEQYIEFQAISQGQSYQSSLFPLDLEIGGLKIASLFDEMHYLNKNPDVASAVEQGIFNYGFEHFLIYGIHEGRNPASWFDESQYVTDNPDVLAAIYRGEISSGILHFLQSGHFENRQTGTFFDGQDYLLNNPDVKGAIENQQGFTSAFHHYIEAGAKEGRLPYFLFEEAYYLLQNPDVAAALQTGQYDSGLDHFVRQGQSEGRRPSSWFDESVYLANYRDVAAAISQQIFASAFEHFVTYGQAEGRFSI